MLGLQKAKAALQQELIQAHCQALEQRHKNERLTRDYEGELKRELARVKRQVNFIQHAASMGYTLHLQASSAPCAGMEKAGDKILIATSPILGKAGRPRRRSGSLRKPSRSSSVRGLLGPW